MFKDGGWVVDPKGPAPIASPVSQPVYDSHMEALRLTAMAKAKACREQGLLPQQHATPHFQTPAEAKAPPQKLTVKAAPQPPPQPPDSPCPKYLWIESGTREPVEWTNEDRHTSCGQELWGLVVTDGPHELSRRAWINNKIRIPDNKPQVPKYYDEGDGN